ncbi:hypothetical protein [Flavobacterium cellulosilyticum]|uniref:Glycosyltransferase RgtA/B/C/D-like domain-containing protein n=1 Tax=Flavobacterium cellulosilyticum TaxID=2541731 RepID=A0A4R5CBP7_9FLAO|nr:hypothetical protein [Flavobacterium cellulosilyticum]TDD96196.1 hypothetical protein E0F76_11920 [Flavobacterium cellulosilyticum]
MKNTFLSSTTLSQFSSINNSNLYKFLFLFILLFYSIILSQYGFENWDSGFIQGFCWRVLQGEHPYTDFLYIRPPASVYFHSIFMKVLPVEGQYYFTRVIGYWLFALQVYLTVTGFDNIYNLKKINLNKWAIIIVCYIISIHNFFANPWYNVDGIFFASVAFYLMSRFKTLTFFNLFLISFFCVFSALTKQSFYFIPIIFFIWIALTKSRQQTLYFLCSLLIWIATYILFLRSITTLDNYLSQTSEHTRLSDLAQVGIEIYIRSFNNIYLLISSIVIASILFYFKTPDIKINSNTICSFFKWLSITTFFFSLMAIPFMDFRKISVIFFNATIYAFIYKTAFDFQKIKGNFPLIVLICISWCVGLSLGYAFPILYATGLILSFYVLMREDLMIQTYKKTYSIVVIAICIYASLLNIHQYREKNIFQLNYSLEEISPKLKYIKSAKETLEKYRELKILSKEYPNYTVTPSIPLSHYLFDTKNSVPAEWLTNFEINYKTSEFFELIKNKTDYVFLEKSFIKGEILDSSFEKKMSFSSLSIYLYFYSKPITETQHFIVYKSSDIKNVFIRK